MVNYFFKLLLVFLFSNFLRFDSCAQEDTSAYAEQREILNETYDQIYNLDDLVLLDALLEDSTMSSSMIKGGIYMARAEKRWQFINDSWSEYFRNYYEEEEEEITFFKDSIENELQKILADYDRAIEICSECSVNYQYKRFEFLNTVISRVPNLNIIETSYLPRYESDFKALSVIGYKEERVGVGVGFSSYFGKDTWLGGEVSVFSAKEPLNRLKYKSSKDGSSEKYWINMYPVFGSGLTLSYHYGLNTETHDFGFGLVEIISPLHISLLNFGLLETNYSSKLLAYYRPEIGIGFGNVSVFYAYNAVFKKSMRGQSEKHLFGIKIKLIPVRFKSRISDDVYEFHTTSQN